MSSNQREQQVSNTNYNFSTPVFSVEAIMRFQIRNEEIEFSRRRQQEELDRKSNIQKMNNLAQLLRPGCEIDVNSMALSANLTPQAVASTSTSTGNETQQTIPIPKKGSNNKSKQLPWVVILELRCMQPTNNGTCNQKVATEDELEAHLLDKHRIHKYRCLDKNCDRSFRRR